MIIQIIEAFPVLRVSHDFIIHYISESYVLMRLPVQIRIHLTIFILKIYLRIGHDQLLFINLLHFIRHVRDRFIFD